MLGTQYSVSAKYTANTASAVSNVNALASSMGQANTQGSMLKSTLAGIGASAAGFFAVDKLSGALDTIGRKMFELNNNAVESRIAIGSILTLNNLSDFEYSMKRSATLLDKFTEAAKRTKGESSDLITIVSQALPAIASINPSNQELSSFGARSLAASNVLLGSDYELAGSQMLQIFSGQAGSDNRLYQAIQKPLLDQLGIKETGSKATEEFNKMVQADKRKVFEAMQGVLAQFDSANDMLMNTMGGQWARLNESINGYLKQAGGPAFDFLTEKLGEVNDWFDKNTDTMKQLAEDIGSKLVRGLEAVGDAAKFAHKNMDALVISGGALLALRTLGAANITTGIANFGPMMMAQTAGLRGGLSRAALQGSQRASALSSFIVPSALRATDAWKYSGVGGKAVATGQLARWRAGEALQRARGGLLDLFAPSALRATDSYQVAGRGGRMAMAARFAGWRAQGALSSGLGIAAMRNSAGYAFATAPQRALMMGRAVGGSMMGGISNAASGLLGMTGIKSLGATLAPMLKVAGPLALAFVAIYGAMQVLKDETNASTKYFRGAINDAMKELDKLAGAFGYGAGEGGFIQGAKDLAFWIGERLVDVMGFAVKGVALVIEGFNQMIKLAEIFGGAVGYMYMQYEKAGGGISGLRAIDMGEAFSRAMFDADSRESERNRQAKLLADERDRKRKEEIDRKKLENEENAEKAKAKMNVKVTINQEIKTDASPDRIAIKTGELLTDIFKNKRIGSAGL